MSKIYVAFASTGSRIASGSATTLRQKVRVYPETTWSVYLYDFKISVEVLIVLMEGDISKWPPPTLFENWKVTTSGQVREFDPTKIIT